MSSFVNALMREPPFFWITTSNSFLIMLRRCFATSESNCASSSFMRGVFASGFVMSSMSPRR